MDIITVRAENMAKCRRNAEELCNQWNKARNEDKPFSVLKELEEKIAKEISEANKHAKAMCYEALKASDTTMAAACTMMRFPTIKVKETADKENDIVIKSIDDTNTAIDLEDLQNFCGRNIGQDADWRCMIESFTYRLSIVLIAKIGSNSDEYKETCTISDVAKDFNLGRDPFSNTRMLDTLRKVIAAMIGEEYRNKVSSKSVEFIKQTFSGHGRKDCSAKYADPKQVRHIMMEVCHCALTGEVYTAEYKTKTK